MRILQIITLCELGGAQTVVVNLANKLCERHEVIVASGEGDGRMWNLLDAAVKQEHCKYLQRAVSPVKDTLAAWELRRLYKKYKPDIIHLHSSKAGMLGRLVFPSKKIVYTVHGFDSIRVAYRKFLPIERFMQHFCSAIVGVSEYDHRNLVAERITCNIHTVYNGLSRPDVSNMQTIEAMKRYEKIVLCIARISSPKRHDLFIETARLLPQYGFVWIGNRQDVPEAGLPDNCHFVGNIPNAGAYCSQADMFMLPSNYEGLPMVIIEAMSFGKPVVASDVGGISEIVRNGENGYTLENNAELFADKIRSVLENKSVYDNFCSKSLEYYKSELTVDRMVAGYMNIYNKICR